mmetsp:Transcript_6927/g.19516  ORF Transcript_6927/g.19516 Transcript_6927/m.19516 type:complete len:248 (-) Transcript_6927:685-1428(-)
MWAMWQKLQVRSLVQRPFEKKMHRLHMPPAWSAEPTDGSSCSSKPSPLDASAMLSCAGVEDTELASVSSSSPWRSSKISKQPAGLTGESLFSNNRFGTAKSFAFSLPAKGSTFPAVAGDGSGLRFEPIGEGNGALTGSCEGFGLLPTMAVGVMSPKTVLLLPVVVNGKSIFCGVPPVNSGPSATSLHTSPSLADGVNKGAGRGRPPRVKGGLHGAGSKYVSSVPAMRWRCPRLWLCNTARQSNASVA